MSKKHHNEEIQKFFDQWNIYLKVIHNNYMFHQEIHQILHNLLLKHFQHRPISLLDLGCGDSSSIAETLKDITVSYYHGIDLSDVALDTARNNFNANSFDIDFSQGDFFEIINQFELEFDVILSGYSLHHLNLHQKEILVNKCYEILKKDGMLLVYDAIKKQNETRSEYLKRYWNICESNWNEMTKEEFDIIKAHIFERDFPESIDTFINMGMSCGFKQINSIYQDPQLTHGLFCFYR
jgi:ubiquinone/menaquinone biosynthesis C-methylase UbiE